MVGLIHMNNKGFTLVELLAVILILIGISLVSVASITSSLERNDKKECERQKELVINAAKVYFSLNKDVVFVTAYTLQTDGFIGENTDISGVIESDVRIVNNTFSFEPDQHDSCYDYLN